MKIKGLALISFATLPKHKKTEFEKLKIASHDFLLTSPYTETYYLNQACTAYGPQKILIWPTKPPIVFILPVYLRKTRFECVKTYQLWPLNMSKKFLDPP